MTALFHYTARSGDGAFVRGSLEAPDEDAAVLALRRRSLFVTSVEVASSPRGVLVAAILGGRPHRTAVVAFFRSFAVLFQAGVPIQRALDVVRRQCSDARLRETLAALACELEHGRSLSEAMQQRPRDFSAVQVASVRAAEAGGILEEILERLAVQVERENASRKRLYSALVYPSAVACAAVAMIAFLITSVLPSFGAMYDQLRVPVPPVTAMLIHAGSSLPRIAAWVAGMTVAIAAAAAAFRSRGGEAAAPLERVVRRIPVAGTIVQKSATARFARVLGMLLRAGVGITAALEVIEGSAAAREREDLRALRRMLGEGTGLAEGMERLALHDPLFLQMLRVGEESGTADRMLLRVAEYYELDVESALAALSSLLEPCMILFLGAIVAGIAAAVLVPLYSMIGAIK